MSSGTLSLIGKDGTKLQRGTKVKETQALVQRCVSCVTGVMTRFRPYGDKKCQLTATGDGIVSCTAGSSSGAAL